MKIRVYETVREYVDIEVDDGLEGDRLEAAIEHERTHTNKSRQFDAVVETTWEARP